MHTEFMVLNWLYRIYGNELTVHTNYGKELTVQNWKLSLLYSVSFIPKKRRESVSTHKKILFYSFRELREEDAVSRSEIYNE